MYHADTIADEIAHPPAQWLVLTRDYATQSGDTAALEPDNTNGWYDAGKQELHLVVPTQSPQEVAQGAAAMLASSRIGMKRLFLHPCFTVGYGSKDHCAMPYYGLLAALYGDGRPVRLANDRFDQFQAGLKRHQFSMRYTMTVERESGRVQSFRAGIVANGGGGANCSVALTMVGATSAQSVYYFPKADVAATAIASRAIDCGAARGYGALETLTATELMVDELAGQLGLDPIEFRLRNVLKRDEERAGRDPARHPTRRGGAGEGADASTVDGPRRAQAGVRRGASRKILRGRLRRHPAALRQRRGGEPRQGRTFARRPHHALAHRDGDRDGRVLRPSRRLRALAGAAGRCPRHGRDRVARPPVETSGDPHAMSQAEQDRLAGNPRWSPAYASASSASNSSYYFSHTTREAARIVFVHGLWPAALEIWGAQAQSRATRPDEARWIDGSLTLEGREPLALSRLAAQAHARGLVVGAAVHGFNRWQWAQAEFIVDGASARIAADGLSVRYGDRATAAKQALATTPNRYQVLDRRSVSLPPTVNNNAMVGYNTAVGTLAELAVDAASGKVALLTHHTILECGDMLVPQLVSGQIQGGTASGIGLALHEELPLYEDGPGDGTWNFNRYRLPRGSDVAVWAQTADVLPPLSDSEPPKGMAEVVMIPIIAAIVNGIAHAIDHRFRTLPVTPDRVLAALS